MSKFLSAMAVMLLAPVLVSAEPAVLDQEFLDLRVPEVETFVEGALPLIHGSVDAMKATRELLGYRYVALMELDQRTPLSTFDGIETQDTFEEQVIRALHRIQTRGYEADSIPPSPTATQAFNARLGSFPDLGQAPAPFMVLGLTELAATAYDSTLGTEGVSDRDLAKAANFLIYAATKVYMASRADIMTRSGSQSFRQNSVIMRMRCPKDGGTYNLNQQKNRVEDSGDLSTIYYLQCTVCADPAAIEFHLEYQSRLNKLADRQKMKRDKEKPKGLSP